ncbi:MAG: hypothetical protein EON93_04375, partial [Burkholderiales bacterium]
MKHIQRISLVIAAFGLTAECAIAHDLRGIVGEANATDVRTQQKIDEINAYRKLMAQLVKPGSGHVEAVVRTALRWNTPRITVCFQDGTTEGQLRVAAVAREWSHGTGVLFDFGAGSSPRLCDTTRPSDIRVSFGPGGFWSYVGTIAREIPPDRPTLNLDGLSHPGKFTDYEHSVVLHEFGHALGFEHEHQSPKSGCQEQFNWPYLYSSMGWEPEKVRFNMARFDKSGAMNGLESTDFDRASVMLYSLNREAFVQPTTASCYIPQANIKLSSTDLSAARYLY